MMGAAVGVAGVFSASAVDITIFDGQSSGTSGWYSARENNETEPGTITSQAWDLESMSIVGTKLTITGGYDYRTGAYSGGKWYRRGDILIDLNGDAKTTWDGTVSDKTANSYFKYDYAIHFSTAANDLRYTIVDLNQNSKFVQVTDIQRSNPWRLDDNYLSSAYIDGKSGVYNADFDVLAPDAEGAHYGLSVDLSNYLPLLNAIKAANEMLVKYTMECGNDTILGLASIPSLELASDENVPDTGTSLALLGFGLAGLTLMSRRSGLALAR